MEIFIYLAAFIAAVITPLSFFYGKHKGKQKCEPEIANLQFSNKSLNEQGQNLKNLLTEAQDLLLAKENEIKELNKRINLEVECRSKLEGQISELLPLKATNFAYLQKNGELERTNAQLQSDLENERCNSKDKLDILSKARTELTNHFQALCANSLKSNSDTFLQTATAVLDNYQNTAKGDLQSRQLAIENSLKPVVDTLAIFGTKISEIEGARQEAYGSLTEQVSGLMEIQKGLHSALAAPKTRGRWGEIQLRRVVELSGMLNHCDFEEQPSSNTEAGQLRPDLIVKLVGGKNIVVDAKVPLTAYMEAFESTDEKIRAAKLKDHARQLRDHVTLLSKKKYWEQFNSTTEMVVLYLSGDNFYNAAIEQDGTLLEYGIENKVLIATPLTLVAILKSLSIGWKQHAMAENAEEICLLGKTLYKRIVDMVGHFSDVGAKLGKAVESYNSTVGTFENRVLSSARKFKGLNTTAGDVVIDLINPIEVIPRQMQLLQ